jgi:hypothetical protein
MLKLARSTREFTGPVTEGYARSQQGGFETMHIKCSGALGLILLLASSLAMSSPLLAQQENAQMPKVGDMAPDFTLHYFDGSDLKAIKLSDYRGKQNVVLAFYVFAFTGG